MQDVELIYKPSEQNTSLLIRVPQKLNLPKNKHLFSNNYHMMAEHYGEDYTRRSIRKHILTKYGRLMPVKCSFGIEGQEQNLPPSLSNYLEDSMLKSFGIVKEIIGNPSQNDKMIKLNSNITVREDEVHIARHHTVFQKITQRILHEDSVGYNGCISRSVEKPNKTPMRSRQYSIDKRSSSMNSPSQDLVIGNSSSQHVQEKTIQQVSDNLIVPGGKNSFYTKNKQLYRKNGKHVILLKNLFAI